MSGEWTVDLIRQSGVGRQSGSVYSVLPAVSTPAVEKSRNKIQYLIFLHVQGLYLYSSVVVHAV